MKTSIIITIVFWFISLSMNAQHDHEGLEEFFHTKSLAVFEKDLELSSDDFQKQQILTLVDDEYQNFQSNVRSRLDQGIEISDDQFKTEYSAKVISVKEQIGLLSDIDLPAPVFTPKAINGPCVNMDFEDGDFNGWDLTRGNVDGSVPYSFVGEFPVGPSAYHQIFGGGVDPVTGIPTVNPLGGAFSARLGNGTGTGARAARMKQTFLVDATNYLYTYSYAVVFESPNGHALNELPYFTVRVFDELGANVPCGEYSVIADAASAPDYLITNWGGTTVLYQNWQTVFTNLSAYIGQNVTIEFTAGDCALTGHFGYAYVDASCAMSQIIASNNIICTGESAILTAPPGAASYLWSTGEITQAIEVFSGGNYSCTLTPFQGGGCEIVLDIDIIENPTPTANFSSNTVVACINDVIDFTDLSTIPNPGIIANYRWDFGDGTIAPLSNGPIVAVPNTTGTYIAPSHTYTASGVFNVELYVESADGCSDNIIIPVTINALPIVNAGADQTVCEGTAVTLSGSGATSYVWDNGITDGVPFVQGVGTITYTVTGTDANGCQNTDQADVTVNPIPIVNAGADQTVCEGTVVTLNGSGASGYVWDNGVTNGTPFVQGVGTITYTVTGTDGNGCQNTDQVDVTVNPLPIVNAGADQTVCEGTAVTLNGAGANGYAWDNGVTDGVPFVQGFGTITYTVTGTDANGCQNTDQADVTVNPLPNVNAGIDQVVCEGTAVTLTGAGAVGYVWDNGITDGVPFVQGVGTITYTVTGTDANGCQNTDQADIIVNPLPIVNAGLDQTVCEGTAVTLNGSGANGYAWDNGVTDGVPFVKAVGSITYTLTGTDVNGCQNTDQVIVLVNPNPVINAGVDQSSCDGQWITLNATGAPSLIWDNAVVNNVPFQQTVGTINYTVTGTLATGCFATDAISVTVLQNPTVTTGNVVICEGEAAILSGAGAVSYVWTGGVENGQAFYPSQSDVYTVIGTAANGCSSEAQATVTVNHAPYIDFDVLNLHLTTTDPTTGFNNLSVGAVSYEWNFSDGSPINTQFEPVHTFPEDQPGEYIIELTGYSEFGCPARDIKYVHIFRDYIIYVPNAFTPDNSGVNEVFKPVMTGFDEQGYTMYIFNRWGDLIFETHDMQVGWDGTFHNDNTRVQDGVFTWKIEGQLKDSADTKIFVGHISILK
jgi:gliding motility-associated-like protein